MGGSSKASGTTVAPEKSEIKRIRLSKNISLRELAGRLGVTAGAVSQMERSEERGSIQIGTLTKALAAMDVEFLKETRSAAPRHHIRAPFERREDRVAFELHRAIAKKLLDDPETVLSVVPANIAQIRQHTRGPLVAGWLDKWDELSGATIGTLVNALLDTSDEGIEMRQNGPFMGVLTQQERLEAIARASR